MVCHGRTKQHIYNFKNSDMNKSQSTLRKRKKRDIRRKTVRKSLAMIGGTTLPTAWYGSPVYYPRKHTKMSYAQQNRLAKKRRKAK